MSETDTPAIIFSLSPPETVTAVSTNTVNNMTSIDESVIIGLQKMVFEYVESLCGQNPTDPNFEKEADKIRTMGHSEIKKASAVSNNLLDKSLKNVKKTAGTHSISETLLTLRTTIEALDPKQLTTKKKMFGLIPLRTQVKTYFQKYESNQAHLNAIIQSLYSGQDELRKDNISLVTEKENLWEIIQRMQRYIYVVESLEDKITKRIEEYRMTDPQKAKALQDDILFNIRQKHQDLLTQQAIATQGYLAIDVIIKNNKELIKGIDRATITTMSALRIAIIVAEVLYNQQLVLNQISALNTATNNVIRSTSETLKRQTSDIHAESISSSVELEQLKTAFANIYQTMDVIDNYRAQALESMSTTTNALSSEMKKAQNYLDQSN